jgi:hypothetical protein
VNAEKARAILAQAKADETYEGPIPEDDSKAISEANNLVEQAQTAWDQFARGPEVESILRIAKEDFGGDATPEAIEESEAPADEVSDVVPDAPAPMTEEEMQTTEPWDNYSIERVSDVISGINAAVDSFSEQDLTDLMGHIWIYEEANKRRATVLTHLQDIANRLENGSDLPDDPEDAQPDAPGTPEPEVEPEPEPTPEPNPEPAPAPAADPEPEPEPEPAREPEEVPTPEPEAREPEQERSEYSDLVSRVNDELSRERMHTPEPPSEEVPDLPWDWTKMSDAELHRFYGIYSNICYYKSYLLERDERMTAHCRQAADEIHNALLVRLDKYDDNGKQKTMTLLEAEIENHDLVKSWRHRQRKHEMYASGHRRERDSLIKLVEALSRAESMRQQEWERSGGKSGRRVK